MAKDLEHNPVNPLQSPDEWSEFEDTLSLMVVLLYK
jgi:hypothetical protein